MMKLKMKENLHGRYDGSILNLLNKVAFLDPQFKSLMFVADSEKSHTIDQVIMEATTCYVSASEPDSSTRSTFCGERKLLHILEDIIQPRTEQEGDNDIVGNDNHDKAIGKK